MNDEVSATADRHVSELRGRARRNVLATLLGRAISIALNLIVTLWVIQYLGPGRYGVYVMVFNIITLLDLATELSLFEITVREIAKSDDAAAEWLAAATHLRALFGAILTVGMLLAPTLVKLEPEASSVVRMGAMVFAINSMRTPVTWFRARLMIHWELGLWALSRVIELCLIAVIIRRGGGTPLLMGAKVVASAFFVVAVWSVLLGGYHVPLRSGRARMRELIILSIPVGLTALLMQVQLKGDIFMIGSLLGRADAGAFGAVAQVPEFVLVAASILVATVGPVLAKLVGQGDVHRFQGVFQRVFDGLVLTMPPVCALCGVLARPLVRLAFGPGFENVAPHLTVVVWVGGMIPIAALMGVTAITLNLQRRLVAIELLNVVIYLGANALLLPVAGSIASAWIRLLVVLIGPSRTYRVIRSSSSYRLSLRAVRLAAPATAAATLTAWLLVSVHPILAAGAGAAVYACIVFGFRGMALSEGSNRRP